MRYAPQVRIYIEMIFPKLSKASGVISQEATSAADDCGIHLSNNLKIALVRKKKTVTLDTHRSVHTVDGGSSRNFFARRVVASRSIIHIQDGRRAGAKMPMRQVGTGPRGGKIFEPMPQLLKWFVALGIPRAIWFPIMRAIKARGIQPTDVQGEMIKMSRAPIKKRLRIMANNIARRFFKG